MAAYENLSGFVGQKFQTEYLSQKKPKPVVQKIITKVSSVSRADVNVANTGGKTVATHDRNF
jgi:hypothetical protein